MNERSTIRLFVPWILLLHIALLVWVSWTLPIGPHEAKIYFQSDDIVSSLMHIGRSLFPELDFINIRAPFLFIHLLNLSLFYKLCRVLLKDETAIWTSFLVFLLLPGIVSSAVLASTTGIILALYQTFLLLFFKHKKYAAYMILPLFLFIDGSCVIFYFALLTYALWQRDTPLLGWVTLLFGIAVSVYGIDMHGKPVNHFTETIGLYAAIFSPLLFLYFFYAIYRILFKGRKDIIWHIAFTILLLSLLVSLRQRIPIEHFAPYVIVAIPLMVQLFFSSYRVRLPQFRRWYKILAAMVLGVLIVNTLLILVHRPLFLMLKNPRHHFAASFYLPYWCAQALKREGIDHITNGKYTLQFRYYGIEGDGEALLRFTPCPTCKKVSIRYRNRAIQHCYVSKINK
jgi:hypothetical protein